MPVQLVHLPKAGPSDLDAVAEAVTAGRRVGLAACPRSNARLGNGLPDLPAWTARRIPWGLGTDGAPAVNRCDMFAEMRFALLAHGGPARDALARATLEAARSLGLQDAIGSLEAGKQADLAAVRVTAPRCVPAYDPVSVLVHCADPSDVVLTMVGGHVLYDGSEIATVDEPRVAARCQERAGVLWAGITGRRVVS